MNHATNAYAEEIRSWLVARLERSHSAWDVDSSSSEQTPARVQLWWLLEGKRFALLGDGSLIRSWEQVLRHVQRLLTVHSPAARIVPVPEGEVDWVTSTVQRAMLGRATFHVRASRVGLSDDERSVLLEWVDWVGRQWNSYSKHVGGQIESGVLPLPRSGPTRLRRWAHIAGRSRWPLLREVVAGSLRVFLEPLELDALPLPDDPPRLFEMLCLVRVLRSLETQPKSIRWLDPELGNRIRVGSLSVAVQHVPEQPILETCEFDAALRAAFLRHKLRVPTYIDVLFSFDKPRAGFDGILIEAKSGAQQPHVAVSQLRAYRAALKAKENKRLLIWGIVEAPWPWVPPSPKEIVAKDDLWIFSDAAHIQEALESVGLANTG